MLEPQTCRFAVTAELLRWLWILPHLDIETFFYFQVSAIQEEANRLQGSYAGDKAKEIQTKEDEVVDAWKRLNWRVKQRTERLHDADDLYRFLLAVQDQMLWMNDMLKQILTYEKAKWVSLLYHSPLFWDRYWGGPISHLPIFRLALLTVPDVIFSFVQVFKVANRQFIGFLTLSRCILSVTLS